jgi:hypothetical protein
MLQSASAYEGRNTSIQNQTAAFTVLSKKVTEIQSILRSLKAAQPATSTSLISRQQSKASQSLIKPPKSLPIEVSNELESEAQHVQDCNDSIPYLLRAPKKRTDLYDVVNESWVYAVRKYIKRPLKNSEKSKNNGFEESFHSNRLTFPFQPHHSHLEDGYSSTCNATSCIRMREELEKKRKEVEKECNVALRANDVPFTSRALLYDAMVKKKQLASHKRKQERVQELQQSSISPSINHHRVLQQPVLDEMQTNKKLTSKCYNPSRYSSAQ